MLDHTSDADHEQWLSEFGERFKELLTTGRFHIRENTLLKRAYASERLVALSSGLMREERSVGRPRTRFKFRIELLDRPDQLKLRRMFGATVEWVDTVQIRAATSISRSTAARRCERTAAMLIAARNTMRIIKGEVAYSKDWLISVSNSEVQQRIHEYCESAQSMQR
jgi:hypothetical protein